MRVPGTFPRVNGIGELRLLRSRLDDVLDQIGLF
jgi:hypothetical protein